MRFVWVIVLVAIGLVPAHAETNLLDSATWTIVGTDDAGPDPRNIAILVDNVQVGAFSEVNFSYNFTGIGTTQVFSIKGNGALQPILPPPSVPGAHVALVSYWDCEQGLIPPMDVVELSWKSKVAGKPVLDVRGKISNQNSMQATDVRLRFLTPETNSVSVEMQFQLKATRDFCVDLTKHPTQEEFRVVTFLGNYVSTNVNENDQVRYVKDNSTDCGPFIDCGTSKESVCVSLTNEERYLFNKPQRLADPRIWFIHRQATPQDTPTLIAEFHAPGKGRFKPQGFVIPTADPSEENVRFWGNWVDAKRNYNSGKKVAKFRFTLSAEPPREFGCEQSR